MDDLLKSAQKTIDDASGKLPNKDRDKNSSSQTHQSPNSPPDIPAPKSMTGEDKKQEKNTGEKHESVLTSSSVPSKDTKLTPTTPQSTPKDENASSNDSSAPLTSPPTVPPPKKKRSRTGLILSMILLFIFTVPIGVYYVSQQQQLADIRSQAKYEEGTPCPDDVLGKCIDKFYKWDNIRGTCKKKYDPDTCGGGKGEPPEDQICSRSISGAPCQGGQKPGDSCKNGTGKCVGLDNVDGNGNIQCSCRITEGQPTPTPGPTATPTPESPGPQCRRIVIAKDNELVDPSTLNAGDEVIIGVVGNNATKARARVNGGEFIESSEDSVTIGDTIVFGIPFTIPTDTANFTIEAEVFNNGVWQ